MAESIITVCDDCGDHAVETLLLRVAHSPGAREKDVCKRHLNEGLENTRPSKRGRKKVVASGTAKRRGRPRGSKTTRRKSTRRKTTTRRSHKRKVTTPETEAA